jgi:hypothetical protein
MDTTWVLALLVIIALFVYISLSNFNRRINEIISINQMLSRSNERMRRQIKQLNN